jgi:hypothetical protein
VAEYLGDVCHATGKYEKDGQEKTSFTKIGKLFRTDKGYRILLFAAPVGGGEDGTWLPVFEPRNQQQQSAPPPKPKAPEEDIPF